MRIPRESATFISYYEVTVYIFLNSRYPCLTGTCTLNGANQFYRHW
jgi:hypothetical protein